MPWRIEDELKALGANYIQAGLWRGFAVRDGNLVTGQQNFSGGDTVPHRRNPRPLISGSTHAARASNGGGIDDRYSTHTT
jgi:hypothetical protein